jgi:hypothetical protein
MGWLATTRYWRAGKTERARITRARNAGRCIEPDCRNKWSRHTEFMCAVCFPVARAYFAAARV